MSIIRQPPTLGEALARISETANHAATTTHVFGPRRPTPPDIHGREPSVWVVVPVKTKNPTNNREHWRAVSRRAKQEHAAVYLALAEVDAETKAELAKGCVVQLTRISSGRLDANDGIQPALKAVKDAVAAFLLGGRPGERDEDERLTWRYEQAKGPRGTAGVIVSIRVR